jgi:hypothetical protein
MPLARCGSLGPGQQPAVNPNQDRLVARVFLGSVGVGMIDHRGLPSGGGVPRKVHETVPQSRHAYGSCTTSRAQRHGRRPRVVNAVELHTHSCPQLRTLTVDSEPVPLRAISYMMAIVSESPLSNATSSRLTSPRTV